MHDGYKILNRKQTFLFNIIGCFLIIGFILPTSKEEFAINPLMRFQNYYLLDIVALFIILYERKFDKKRIASSILVFSFLSIFTFIAICVYKDYRLTVGNLLLYGSYIICCNVTFRKVLATKLWDLLFLAMMAVILVFGFGTVLMNETLNGILRLYYVDHLSFFLDNMLIQLKPVTFFTSHSMAAFNYSLFIVVLFVRQRYYYKQFINKLFIMGFIVLMIFLRSNSSIMLLLLLFGLYFYYSAKRMKGFDILVLFITLNFIVYFIIDNRTVIETVFASNDNGLKGRFSQEGALSSSIKFLSDFNIPTGLTDIKYRNHWIMYRDSSYLINMMRGGIFLVFAYTYIVVRFIKQNINNLGLSKLFILLVLLYDLGYPFTWEQRFLTGFLFMMPYLRFLLSTDKIEKKDHSR